jgi:hypothetical protein
LILQTGGRKAIDIPSGNTSQHISIIARPRCWAKYQSLWMRKSCATIVAAALPHIGGVHVSDDATLPRRRVECYPPSSRSLNERPTNQRPERGVFAPEPGLMQGRRETLTSWRPLQHPAPKAIPEAIPKSNEFPAANWPPGAVGAWGAGQRWPCLARKCADVSKHAVSRLAFDHVVCDLPDAPTKFLVNVSSYVSPDILPFFCILCP